ncbi:MAG: hypothetical protein GY832_31740 [Chloroflexi bacterium]|nr:hypothetical protein [Chloroflexota bacterium]
MIVFLDCDGILADWNAGVHAALGISHDYEHWPYAKGRDGWNWHDEIGVPFKMVNALCDFDLWADLPWMHDGRAIYDRVAASFGLDNIRLLTTPMPSVQSASGKMAWAQKNIPELAEQVIITTAPKETLAGTPNSLLIDDSSKNVDAWRGAGGRAILVPRHWNDDYELAMRTEEVVADRLRGLQHG